MQSGTVVHKIHDDDEVHFHQAVLHGLERAKRRLGGTNGHLARAMGITVRQLHKIFHGSVPRMRAMFALLRCSPDALDDVARLHGFRLVPRDCPHNTVAEDFAIAITAGQLWLAEAMHSNSELGPALSRNELMDGEERVRSIHLSSGAMLDLIAQAKDHKLHSVAGHAQ